MSKLSNLRPAAGGGGSSTPGATAPDAISGDLTVLGSIVIHIAGDNYVPKRAQIIVDAFTAGGGAPPELRWYMDATPITDAYTTGTPVAGESLDDSRFPDMSTWAPGAQLILEVVTAATYTTLDVTILAQGDEYA